ncbi:MAG: Transcriptional regulator, MarR family, partial [uncultured Rubrobacteraceae bacterium]
CGRTARSCGGWTPSCGPSMGSRCPVTRSCCSSAGRRGGGCGWESSPGGCSSPSAASPGWLVAWSARGWYGGSAAPRTAEAITRSLPRPAFYAFGRRTPRISPVFAGSSCGTSTRGNSRRWRGSGIGSRPDWFAMTP